jgi:hypothetical protein
LNLSDKSPIFADDPIDSIGSLFSTFQGSEDIRSGYQVRAFDLQGERERGWRESERDEIDAESQTLTDRQRDRQADR